MSDGPGPNPLLQDHVLVLFHPPTLYLGYVGMSVPFSFAIPRTAKGTVLKVTSWHDNTAANKANPDPNVWVGFGDRTVDEMNHVWMNVTYLDEPDYLAEVEARRAKLTQQQ